MAGERIWVVDAEHWPRAYLLAELTERGYDVTGFETARDAVVRAIVASDQRPALMVIDLHGQSSDHKALDALVRQEIPTVAIAGTTTAAATPVTADGVIGDHPWAATLRRPLTIGTIVEAVSRLLSAPARSRGSGAPPPKPER
jgi:DNA-binding NtrC family response regulator